MEELSVKRNKHHKNQSSREQLELLDKKDLIDRILQLEAHTFQLKNIIKKSDSTNGQSVCKKSGKPFDFTQCDKRHILLKFYYLGWNYHGFVEQEDTINTIEYHIFEALKKSCLIENRESSNYHRCGRTDKGVSAFSQVISLDVRSKLAPEHQKNLDGELSYCKMLNRILPRDIRCVTWAPIGDDYSARFDCKRRSYKYFFPRGNLDIDAMNKAASYLVGHHDFRNICKMDVANGVVTFARTVLDARIICHDDGKSERSGYNMYHFYIKSQAFLWHQIRCIMGILLLVGQGKEKPEIFLDLFDIDACPRKPQYSLAHEIPLNLFHCDYDDVVWYYDDEELVLVIKALQEDWTFNSVKADMIRSMLQDLECHVKSQENMNFQSEGLIQGVQSKIYQPLMKRVTCESLENRIKHFEKKRKIAVANVEQT
ncbi:tRNA pseudouridine(38/39) synthase [Diachasmimorpha longicaudata]|uniref:tRNA pseudouridine(38/39) synthase n=1 Tax=Diachasmimorpha longicaudata TaxID=58733 RepID=UPI0030B8B447